MIADTKLKDIDVVILCGGEGRRLREVISDRPKPMARFNRRTFLDILIDHVSGYGFSRFILCTGYKSDVVEEYYASAPCPQEILISCESEPLGTAGAVKNAEGFVQSDTFLVMNGDSFCPEDLAKFFDFHVRMSALLSMIVKKTRVNRDGGMLQLDDSRKIIEFQEKGECATGYINAGIYLFDRDILSRIPPRTNYSLELDLFPGLVGQGFYGYVTQERMIDIGTPERYRLAQSIFKK